jgi:hypothetical protein
VVVATRFVLWNWSMVIDTQQWERWANSSDIFLEGYRTTADRFPIIQAVIEPLGLLLAFAAVVILTQANRDMIGTVRA